MTNTTDETPAGRATPWPVLIYEGSFDDDENGHKAFSTDNPHLQHPLTVGQLVWTREMGEPERMDRLAIITVVPPPEPGFGSLPYWVYSVKPLEPPVFRVHLEEAIET